MVYLGLGEGQYLMLQLLSYNCEEGEWVVVYLCLGLGGGGGGGGGGGVWYHIECYYHGWKFSCKTFFMVLNFMVTQV